MAKDRASRRARLRQKTSDTAAGNKQDSNTAFAQEYAYVLKDLRWVFILAAIMFVLLIILNVVLL